MATASGIAHRLRVRGVIAPAFVGLAIGMEVIDLQRDSPVLFWMGLCYLAVALAFSRDADQLLVSAAGE
jgi:hypothetical protein